MNFFAIVFLGFRSNVGLNRRETDQTLGAHGAHRVGTREANVAKHLDHLLSQCALWVTIEVRTKTGSSRCLQKFLSAGTGLNRNVGSGEFVLPGMHI